MDMNLWLQRQGTTGKGHRKASNSTDIKEIATVDWQPDFSNNSVDPEPLQRELVRK